MRWLALLLPLAMAACAGNPKALGITGPGDAALVPPAGDSNTGATDLLQDTNPYAPAMVPTTEGGRYWNYY